MVKVVEDGADCVDEGMLFLNTSVCTISIKVELIIVFKGWSLTILTTKSIILTKVSWVSIGLKEEILFVLLLALSEALGSSIDV